MHLTQALVHVVGWVILASAVTFCVACGLYVAAEWLEDHVRTSFRLIKRATQCSLAVQLAWLLLDRAALLPNLVGMASHGTSWLLLRHHPHHLDTALPLCVAAVALLIAHQTSWIYWWFSSKGISWAVVSVLASLVWPVPTMLLLSAASSDSALPVCSPLAAPTAAAAAHNNMRLSNNKASLDHRRPSGVDTRSRIGADQQQQQQHAADGQQAAAGGFMGMLQQQQRSASRRSRSMVVRGFRWLQWVARKHELLPVTEVDAEVAADVAAAPVVGLMSRKLARD